MINPEIQKYIEENIFPSYQRNDLGHGLDHIKYVIERSIHFANTVSDINYDMCYVIAAYHDIGHYIDADNHAVVSSEMLLKDVNLRKFFTEKEIEIMANAVCDHRASLEYEPRSIYGKIVSSADRNTILDIPLKRTYSYRIKHNPEATLDEIIEESRMHLLEKFGRNGYANKKMYFQDEQYDKFLQDITELVEDTNAFRRRYLKVNNLENN